MTGFHGHRTLPTLFFPFILAGIATAASRDPRLLSLVPSGAPLVAGISASSQGQPDNFVLVTHYNMVDLQDFFALTGADSTRMIHQIILVAGANNDVQLNEHSLLASGHFDQAQVFKSAAEGGAAVTNYRRVPVLEIQPFARERGTFNDVRWLTVLDSSVLVFGSVGSMRVELDRYLARSQPDQSLQRRLAHLRSKDQAWCLLSGSVRTRSSPAREQEIHDVLAALSPELAELARSGNDLEFGLFYGRRVEFEYEVTFASTTASRVSADPLKQAHVTPAGSASLLPALNMAGDGNTLHRVIEVSVARYKTWLEGIRGGRVPVD